METQARVCPFTKEPFVPKRSNQLFVNSSARIKFNNYIASVKRKEKSPIDKPLDKNRKIITQILGTSTVATKTKDFLLGAGFDFSIMTHARLLDNGGNLVCIYDVAYYKLPDGEYKLLRL